jgi:hypothetical protein
MQRPVVLEVGNSQPPRLSAPIREILEWAARATSEEVLVYKSEIDAASDAVAALRKKKILTSGEQSRIRAAFDDRQSRQEIQTSDDVKRAIAELQDSVQDRTDPKKLPAKQRETVIAVFPDEETAALFARLWRGSGAGAYGMARDGKRATWKAHPRDHRRHAAISAAKGFGGKVTGE